MCCCGGSDYPLILLVGCHTCFWVAESTHGRPQKRPWSENGVSACRFHPRTAFAAPWVENALFGAPNGPAHLFLACNSRHWTRRDRLLSPEGLWDCGFRHRTDPGRP